MATSTNVILSIKPKYAFAILEGVKTVEFRKSVFGKDVNKVYIYASSPVKQIVGFFTIKEIISDSPELLWIQYKDNGSISKEDYFKYFGEKKIGFSILIDKVVVYKKHINPNSIKRNFYPPQSFLYQ